MADDECGLPKCGGDGALPGATPRLHPVFGPGVDRRRRQGKDLTVGTHPQGGCEEVDTPPSSPTHAFLRAPGGPHPTAEWTRGALDARPPPSRPRDRPLHPTLNLPLRPSPPPPPRLEVGEPKYCPTSRTPGRPQEDDALPVTRDPSTLPGARLPGPFRAPQQERRSGRAGPGRTFTRAHPRVPRAPPSQKRAGQARRPALGETARGPGVDQSPLARRTRPGVGGGHVDGRGGRAARGRAPVDHRRDEPAPEGLLTSTPSRRRRALWENGVLGDSAPQGSRYGGGAGQVSCRKKEVGPKVLLSASSLPVDPRPQRGVFLPTSRPPLRTPTAQGRWKTADVRTWDRPRDATPPRTLPRSLAAPTACERGRGPVPFSTCLLSQAPSALLGWWMVRSPPGVPLEAPRPDQV